MKAQGCAVGEVPTSSVILYIPGIMLLLGEFALPSAMYSNLKMQSGKV
jgi:hypothetical protein